MCPPAFESCVCRLFAGRALALSKPACSVTLHEQFFGVLQPALHKVAHQSPPRRTIVMTGTSGYGHVSARGATIH